MATPPLPPAGRYLPHTPEVVAAPPRPTCLRCGKRLQLTPLGWGEPSIDAMNLAAGASYCQACLIVEVLGDFH